MRAPTRPSGSVEQVNASRFAAASWRSAAIAVTSLKVDPGG
jgi:hypothetical protein